MANVPWISGKKYDYTEKNVKNSPDADGVYGLVRGAEETIVYIGQGNIRDRLTKHFGGDNPRITKAGPTHYYREICADCEEREEKLLAAYKTIANIAKT